MALDRLELLSEHGSFGGVQRFYKHFSVNEIGLPMRFALFLPPQALAGAKVPLLTFLAGLTCTEETATMKAGAQRLAAQLGLALLMPDTSPRNTGIDSEDHHWDFGVGAGFYLDATEHPWAGHWQMESYLLKDLIPGVVAEFGLDGDRLGITGHSMGGHGALTLALRHPGVFRSVSALAPICAPTKCPWGHKAFLGYLGQDESTWAAHDASLLMAAQTSATVPRRHPGRPGPGRQISGRAALPRGVRGGVRPGRPAVDIAPPRRLRPRLLLHRQRDRRPPAPPRAGAAGLSG